MGHCHRHAGGGGVEVIAIVALVLVGGHCCRRAGGGAVAVAAATGRR